MQNPTNTPVRPDVPGSSKRRVWPYALGGLAGGLLLMVAVTVWAVDSVSETAAPVAVSSPSPEGGIDYGSNAEPEPVVPDPSTVPEPVETACIDTTTAIAMSNAIMVELKGAKRDLLAYDLAGAETGLHAAADYARQAAAASEADPSISVPMEQAADLFDSAGITIGAGGNATPDLNAATGYILDATEATGRTTSVPC